jgi:oxygen-independent coproporphyrinogen-3 oxidase
MRHLGETLGVHPDKTNGCIEASPETLDAEKVGVLRELGFQRLSLGVQSFVAEELRHVNRRFPFAQNRVAVDLVDAANFPEFNIDLIYGLPGQTAATWRRSLDEATASQATSLFLYPLYVRPLTGLDRNTDRPPSPTPAQMAALYDVALEQLAAAGFRQVTMRQFRRIGRVPGQESEDEYTCQSDGTVGLGAGARSYTRRLHYSTPWKMVARNIRRVVGDYCADLESGQFQVRHGFELDDDEQQRRFTILSLLYDGLRWRDFSATFQQDARTRFAAEWEALSCEDCVTLDATAVRLTARGLRHADIVGQLFFSSRVRHLVNSFEYDA